MAEELGLGKGLKAGEEEEEEEDGVEDADVLVRLSFFFLDSVAAAHITTSSTGLDLSPSSRSRYRDRSARRKDDHRFPPPTVRSVLSLPFLFVLTIRSILSSAKAGKQASGSADTEYRAVLDHLISDLLSTLHLPEWPGAEVLVSTFCRSMVRLTSLIVRSFFRIEQC
jgi:hypothetical protein